MSKAPAPLELTLGPVLFNWPVGRWVDFYARIADEAPVDRVCLGEVVCSKREPFRDEVILDVVDRLERGGKEVVYATLALPTTKREVRAIREMIEAGYLIEANDIATVQLLDGRHHVIGPFLNIYNEAALALHVKLGATRVCLPPELPLDAVRLIAAGNDAVEVFAFGRAPLALSARCYHARAHGCEGRLPVRLRTRCRRPRSLTPSTARRSWPSTVSRRSGMWSPRRRAQIADLREAGVVSLRLSPQSCDMVKVATDLPRPCRRPYHPGRSHRSALAVIALPGPLSDGYLRGLPGVRQLHETVD